MTATAIATADRLGAHPSTGMLSAREMAAATGLSYRQLDYWCRGARGWLNRWIQPAVGSGSRRRFPTWLVEPLAACARLQEAVGESRIPIVVYRDVVDRWAVEQRWPIRVRLTGSVIVEIGPESSTKID